jgi:hypothetical protein
VKKEGIKLEAYAPSAPITKFAGEHPFIERRETHGGTQTLLKEGLSRGGCSLNLPSPPGGPFDAVLAKVTEAVSSRAGKKVEPSQVLLHAASQLGAIVITTRQGVPSLFRFLHRD